MSSLAQRHTHIIHYLNQPPWVEIVHSQLITEIRDSLYPNSLKFHPEIVYEIVHETGHELTDVFQANKGQFPKIYLSRFN